MQLKILKSGIRAAGMYLLLQYAAQQSRPFCDWCWKRGPPTKIDDFITQNYILRKKAEGASIDPLRLSPLYRIAYSGTNQVCIYVPGIRG